MQAGRRRMLGWAALWLTAAAFGAWPLTEGSLDGAATYWSVMAVALIYLQVMLARVKREQDRP